MIQAAKIRNGDVVAIAGARGEQRGPFTVTAVARRARGASVLLWLASWRDNSTHLAHCTGEAEILLLRREE